MMFENHQWLLDVLADLETYARQNQLIELRQMIEKTRQIAASEIAARAAATASSK